MRPWAPLVLLAALLLAPGVAAQGDEVRIAAGTYHVVAIEARDGSSYELQLTSDVPIDVVLVNGTDDAYVADPGNSTVLLERLNTTSVQASGPFPAAGRWTLILDHSDRPEGGANGTANATVNVRMVVIHRIEVTPTPQPATGGGSEGSRNPWPVLMLTAPFWDLGIIGLGGMALWFLIFAAWAAWGYKEGWAKVGVLVAGVAAIVAAWSLIPHRGAAVQTTIPLLVAAGVAWVAYKGATDGRQSLRMAFLGAGLGALAGMAIGHLLSLIWSGPGLMLLGHERFDDPVFMMPVLAGAGAFLLALIRALVDAMEDEEQTAAPASPGITQSFTVQCLRCATPIKVDRSMKRYRVATDRYEFACPNCHAWMEWAEPKPEGAAAA